MNKDLLDRINKMLNVFETGRAATIYDKIYIYADGKGGRRQVTLARGFTEDGGNLTKVVKRYIQKGGKYADDLKEYVTLIGKGKLVDNAEFKKLLVAASKEDQTMRDAQDEIFAEAYLNPGEKWFAQNGFTLPVSMAVIQDSYLHSGAVFDFLRNRFNEAVPKGGGNEKEWIKSYVATRKAWLIGKGGALANTAYRMRFFEEQIKRDNWNFECAMSGNGVKIC